ncbi:hypothetical protein D3C81_1372280 [compost metagenome]
MCFGTAGKVGIAGRYLAGRDGNCFGAVAYRADGLCQAVVHILDGLQQLSGFIAGMHLYLLCQVAGRHTARNIDRFAQRAHDQAQQPEGHEGGDQDAEDNRCDRNIPHQCKAGLRRFELALRFL